MHILAVLILAISTVVAGKSKHHNPLVNIEALEADGKDAASQILKLLGAFSADQKKFLRSPDQATDESQEYRNRIKNKLAPHQLTPQQLTPQKAEDVKNLMNIQTLNLIFKDNDVDKKVDKKAEKSSSLKKTTPKKNQRESKKTYDPEVSYDYADFRVGSNNKIVNWLAKHGKKYKVNDNVDAIVIDLAKFDEEADGAKEETKPVKEEKEVEKPENDADTNAQTKKILRQLNDKALDYDYFQPNIDEESLLNVGKKFKLNDNYDAFVLKVSDLKRLQEKQSRNKNPKRPKKGNRDRNAEKGLNDLIKQQNAKTIVLDLGRLQGENKRDDRISNRNKESEKSDAKYSQLVLDIQRYLNKNAKDNDEPVNTKQKSVSVVNAGDYDDYTDDLAKLISSAVSDYKGKKEPSSSIWRRNPRRSMDTAEKKFGVPFELDISGLGQVNY